MSKVKCIGISPDITTNFRSEFYLEEQKAIRLRDIGKIKILSPLSTSVKPIVKNINNNYLNRERFNNNLQTKIAWIQDYSKNGGAEQSNNYLVSIGNELGFDIAGVTPSNFNKNILVNAHLIVINNIFEFNFEQMNFINMCIYEKRIPYIKYDHDLREFKRINVSLQLFTLSKLNVFISPLHLDLALNSIGNHIKNYSICLPLAIDTHFYKINESIKREQNSVFVPSFRKCGCNISEFVQNNQDKKYFIIGDNTLNVNGNVQFLTNQSSIEMTNWYNKCEYMLHLPVNNWAGERIYFESILCGCKPIVNENVGHSHWKTYNLKQSLYDFWRYVEQCSTH